MKQTLLALALSALVCAGATDAMAAKRKAVPAAPAKCLSDYHPDAPAASKVVSGNARFTVLTPRLVRVEYSKKGVFEDQATFIAVNRDFPTPHFTVEDGDEFFTIRTDSLKLVYRKGTNPHENPNDFTFEMRDPITGGVLATEVFDGNNGNLYGTTRTLDGCTGSSKREDLDLGPLSYKGWAVVEDAFWRLQEGGENAQYTTAADARMGYDWLTRRADPEAEDFYIFAYGHDYRGAMADYVHLGGRIPLPPAYAFGYWYSRYASYTADDFRQLIKDMKDNDFKADVMIMDMDWHWDGEDDSDGRGAWTGWTWNTKLIPDPVGLINDMHKAGLRTALNLHPALGIAPDEDPYQPMCADLGLDPASGENIPWKIEDKDFTQSFFKHAIAPLEQQGVDFWWLDWQQWLTSKYTPGLSETMWINHVFFNQMAKMRPDRRPIIFHRWGGLGSHRYQVGFSGDTFINWPTLGFEPYFTATAANVGYGYWGHDLGGHMVGGYTTDMNDPELFLRWVQFGVFSPIFRTHATKSPLEMERRMWKYPNFEQMRQADHLRYALFPYIYTAARGTYETGVSLCHPLYYDHPQVQEAYLREDQYMFGDDILVAPIAMPADDKGISRREVWLPQGQWWSPSHNKMFASGFNYVACDMSQYPWFVRQGAIIPMNPSSVTSTMDHPDTYILYIVTGAKGRARIYEDEGDSQNYDKEFAETYVDQQPADDGLTITIGARTGTYKGMKANRGYEVQLYAVAKAPSAVAVNGKAVTGYSYDAAKQCLTVTLPSAPCAKAQSVKVAY